MRDTTRDIIDLAFEIVKGQLAESLICAVRTGAEAKEKGDKEREIRFYKYADDFDRAYDALIKATRGM